MNSIKTKYNKTAITYSLRESRHYWLTTHCKTANDYLRNNEVDIVIDIGCGSGAVIRKLAIEFRNTKFIGVDFSAELLQIARSNSETYENIGWLELDMTIKCDILQEIISQHKHILILAIGPLAYYNKEDHFSQNLADLFSAVKCGAFICTFHNKDLFGRKVFNNKINAKKYWNYKVALTTFSQTGDAIYCKFFSFVLFDIINSLSFLDNLFLFSDKALRKIPISLGKNITTAFEIEIIRK